MADQKISARTAIVTPDGTEIFPVVHSSADKRLALSQISSFVNSDLSGRKSVWIPANQMTSRTTNGAFLTSREINGITVPVMAFDSAADEGVNFSYNFPKSWDAGNIRFRPHWTGTGGSAAQTVQFELRGGCFANDAAINTTGFGTAVAVDDAFIANDDVHSFAESGNVTLANAAENQVAFFELIRDVSDDDYGADAELIGIELYYDCDTLNDD